MTEEADGDAATTRVDDPPPEPPADPVSERALADYARRMRPLRIGYAAAITVVVIAALVIVKIAYDHGELSHAHLHTVASAPPSVSASPSPAAQLTRAWTTTDATAIGTPVYDGTIVTHDQHTVRGRDALTGRQTWSYTRTDRTVCTAIQTQGVTVAVYRLHGNCDELTALASDTGTRRWTRTLDKDGAEFNGPATYSINGSNAMFVSHTAIYAVSVSGTADNGNGGLDFWTFHHVGCRINSAVLGNAGALISQTCHRQDCNGHKFCGDGTQLLLRAATTGTDDKSTTNPDIVSWNDLGSDLVPTSAGATVTARDPDGATLHVLSRKSGKQTGQLALSGDAGSGAPSAYVAGTDADLIWIGTHTYALSPTGRFFAWQADTAGVPTITDPSNILSAHHAARVALVATTSGAARIDPHDGKIIAHYAASTPPGSTVYPLGAGLLVAGARTTVYR